MNELEKYEIVSITCDGEEHRYAANEYDLMVNKDYEFDGDCRKADDLQDLITGLKAEEEFADNDYDCETVFQKKVIDKETGELIETIIDKEDDMEDNIDYDEDNIDDMD